MAALERERGAGLETTLRRGTDPQKLGSTSRSRGCICEREEIMKTLILAASAAALLCGIAPAAAQSAASSAGRAGMLCSDLTAMDSAAQTAFLNGYWAGHMDAMGGSGTAAAGAATTGAAGASSTTSTTDTAAAGSTTGSAGANAAGGTAADPTATGSTTSTDTAAGATATGSAAGGFDPNAILTACAGSPTSPISGVLGSSSAMGGSGTTSP